MSQLSTSRRAFMGWSLATLAAPSMAAGESQLRIVFPFNAGSGVDSGARNLADALRIGAGRNAFIDNKPGGGGVIGSLEVLRAAPDGNTVLLNTGAHTTNAVLMRKLPYDPLTSFTPITMVGRGSGWVLAVGPNSPYKTLQQFVGAARKSPNTLSYGSSGIGGSTHVMAALFSKAAGIELMHVPYKGAPITDLMSGVVDSSFQSVSSLGEMIRSNRLRALGVSSDRRLAQLPDVPTFKEFGIDADLPGWTGIFGPARMSPAAVDSLYQELVKAGQVKAYQEQAAAAGSEVVMMPPNEFRSYLAQEMATYKKILPPLGIQLD